MPSSTGPPNIGADRRAWRNVSPAERLDVAHKLIVLHPRFRDSVELLKRCHQSKAQAGEPACGAILGASGVGKTSVVDHYLKLHPPIETDTATIQPVLKVTLLRHGRSATCRVNDRGPFVKSRVLDLSPAVAKALKIRPTGLERVEFHKVD